MKTLNLRTFVALLMACILFPSLGGKARADTAKVTLTMSDSPVYELSIPNMGKNNTMSVKTGDDGKITIRALLTLHLLRIPSCYSKSSPKNDANKPFDSFVRKGILGSNFLTDDRTLADSDFDSAGVITAPHNGSADEPLYNEKLYNAIRQFIPRAEQSSLGQRSLLAQAVDLAQAVNTVPNGQGVRATGIKSVDYAFAFGDSLDNARVARKLALLGNTSVHTENFDNSLSDLNASGIRLLTDPEMINSGKAGKDPLSQTNFRNDGRWYFDEYDVTSADLPNQAPMHMMEVSVVWALEATFDPANPPHIPLGGFTSTVTTAPAVAKAVEGGTSDPAAGAGGNAGQKNADQKVASSSQQAAPAADQTTLAGGSPGIFGLTSGQIGAIGTPAQTPGIDLVAGFAIRDNGTPTLLGANITPAGKKLSAGLTDNVLDFNRIGILLGRTTESIPAYITALSLKVNSNALLYIGPAFSNSGGLTRSGISFGAALNLFPILSGNQSASPSLAGKDVEVDFVPGTLMPFPCKKDTQAAILWTTPPDTATAVDTITPTFNQDEKTYSPAITFPRQGGGVSANQFFWLQFVNPGKLAEVLVKKDGVTSYSWSGGTGQNLYLLQMIQPKVLDYATSKNLPIAASQAYNIQVTTDASQLNPVKILKAHPLSGQHLLSQNARPSPLSPVSPLAIWRVPAPPRRPILMHRRMASNTAMTSGFALGALADPPAALPLIPVAGQGGATDLTGAISPPAGVTLDQITLELRDAPNGRVLMSAQLPFIHDRKADHFRWPISRPGVYYLCITANGRRLSAPRKVSPGTALGWVDIN